MPPVRKVVGKVLLYFRIPGDVYDEIVYVLAHLFKVKQKRRERAL